MTPAMIITLISLADKYGIPFVQRIVALMKQKEVTVDDVEALFANVKPFEAYDIKKPE